MVSSITFKRIVIVLLLLLPHPLYHGAIEIRNYYQWKNAQALNLAQQKAQQNQAAEQKKQELQEIRQQKLNSGFRAKPMLIQRVELEYGEEKPQANNEWAEREVVTELLDLLIKLGARYDSKGVVLKVYVKKWWQENGHIDCINVTVRSEGTSKLFATTADLLPTDLPVGQRNYRQFVALACEEVALDLIDQNDLQSQ
jgi:hypothetical protein